VIPDELYQYQARALPTTSPGDILCSNEITTPSPEYRAWVLWYWVKQANGEFIPVSATIRIKTIQFRSL
jgi:hypothetical protein